MSREIYHSLDGMKRREHRNPFIPTEFYVSERSLSVPNIYFRHYGGANNNGSDEFVSDIRFLEDFEDPQFSDLPPESSFDDVRCIMASPLRTPQSVTSTAAKNLDELRSKMAEIIQLGDLRKRMATHFSPSEVDPQSSQVQLDNIRKRITAVITENAAENPLCPYKMPPLPKDPHTIPPPPGDPKDVVALIRRSKAISRLKGLEEKKTGLEEPKGTTKKAIGDLRARKKLTRKLPTSQKFKTVASLSKPKSIPATATQIPKLQNKPVPKKFLSQKTGVFVENVSELSKPQHTSDYAAEYCLDEVLRTRKLAGLKAFNAKVFPKAKITFAPSATMPESPLQQITPSAPKMPTFENILERISAIRSRTDVAKPVFGEKRDSFSPNPQGESEELEEFEVLEELYGAVKSDQRPPIQQNISDLRKRISVLQQQFLLSPVPMEPMAKEELDEFEALEQQLGGTTPFERPTPKYFATDLQDRINALKQTLFQSPTRDRSPVYEMPSILRYNDLQQNKASSAAEIGLVQSVQVRSSSENVPQTKPGTQTLSPAAISLKFDDAIFPLDINEIPDFSDEALADAGFEIENDVNLEEITMPDCDADVSFDEFGIADITSPDFCDVSISGSDSTLEPPLKDDIVAEKVVTDRISQHPGLLTSVVHAMVDRFKNMFSTPKATDVQNMEEETKIERDSSLPNMFEITPYKGSNMSQNPRTQTVSQKPSQHKPVIPSHPKYPKDYKAMVKRAHAIQMKKAQESTTVKDSVSSLPPAKKQMRCEKPTKVYPLGEYSPSKTKPVARVSNKATREARLVRRAVGGLPRQSIEALATPEVNSQPTEKAHKKKNWKELSIMSPIGEPKLEVDFIQFSPLKPHEVHLRLCYLKDQAARQTINTLRAAEKKQIEIEASPISPMQLSPIQLNSPSSSRADATRREKIITKLGTHRRPDITAEAGSSTIESGKVHTFTEKVATKTGKYGNATYDTHKETSLSGDNLADIELPDFLDTSGITPTRHLYIPTTTEIINMIRSNITEDPNFNLPDVQHSSYSVFSKIIAFPHDLPDENLLDIKTPEFARTPRNVSLHLRSISPFEKDTRMYAWGEHPSGTLPTRIPASLISAAPFDQAKRISPIPEIKSVKETICVPPHPTDPKDYNAMIKRAQAIQKLQKQQKIRAGKIILPKQYLSKTGRVPTSRWEELPPKDSKRPQNKRLVFKKRVPKLSPKKIEEQCYDKECLAEFPPLPEKYREAVARARLLHGLKNRAAALNPAVAAKVAKKKTDKAIYGALPEVEKIKLRIEKLRKRASRKRRSPLAGSNNIATLGTESKKLYSFDTPKRSERHGQRFLMHEFPEPHTKPSAACPTTQAAISTPSTAPVMPSTRTLRQASPAIHYSPITLFSSPGKSEPKNRAQQTSAQLTRIDRSAKLDSIEDLEGIEEPSYLDTTPSTPMELPRPRDIIERIRMQIRERCRPQVPTAHLLELETPPRTLPLPTELPEEELQNLSPPSFERTPQSPELSPKRSFDISFPQLFQPTPTSTRLSLSPLRLQMTSPGGPLITSTHPKHSKDNKIMLTKQNEDEALKKAETAKSMKNDKLPISRGTAATSRKPRSVIKKLRAVIPPKTQVRTRGECPEELPPLPKHFKKEIEIARKLAGLKNITAELNSRVAIRRPEEGEDARLMTTKSPMSRYERNQADSTNIPPKFEEKPSYCEVCYSPIRFVSPCIVNDSAETLNQHEFNLTTIENLDELEKLSEIEQPSCMDISKYQITNNPYLPLTPPQTPPPTPSAIINRIRQQYYQNNTVSSQTKCRPMSTPKCVEFPETLPEEQLFEQSAPSFAETSVEIQTPVMTPNISLPRYFEENAIITELMSPRKSSTPITGVIDKKLHLEYSGLPGLKVKAPRCQITIPSHSDNSKDVVAKRREHMIQKRLAKEAADKANVKCRIPFSRKVSTKSMPGKGEKEKIETTRSASACLTEHPELSPKYLAAVAKAHNLADLKNVPLQKLKDAAAKVASYPPTATVMERVASLGAKHKQIAPSARELTHKQHLINHLQRQERKRLLNDLEELQQQQQVLEFQSLKTPTPAEERLKAIKSRMTAEATTFSACPYSPVKTPEVVLQKFQPLGLPQTPPFPFLENVLINDISDVSMQLDDIDNYTIGHETTDKEDLEFELAEIANEAYEFGKNIDVPELDKTKDNFNIADRIQMLQQQLLQSSNEIEESISE